ncbi:MAG: HD domain-containing protein [Spiroplasma sp.]|nr:HD domain-containing protein [Spiroplasma sp.]
MKQNENLNQKVFIRDAIHKNINISEPIIKELINSREFQRLRWISQFGGAQIAFPSATHTRFTHSLGVYHVLNRVFEQVEGRQLINEKDQLIVKIAGLLHDLGHGPFSHSFEKITNFNDDGNYKFNHEFYTCAIISDENTEVNQILKKYHININQIINIINKDYNKCPKYQIQLISSQLDCDRIDYLIRDCYFTGVDYGSINLEWVVSNMIIDPKLGICFNYKALWSIENFLVTRFHMYFQVYFHKGSIFFDLKLQKLFNHLRKLLQENYQWKINIEIILPILKQEVISINEYLKLNDATILKLVQDIILFETDEILLSWAKAILFNQEPYQLILENIKPNTLSQVQVLQNVIYDPTKEPIMIKVSDKKIVPLEKVSQILKNPIKEQKLYYFLTEK